MYKMLFIITKYSKEHTQCVEYVRQSLLVVYGLIAQVDRYVPAFQIRGPFLACLSLYKSFPGL